MNGFLVIDKGAGATSFDVVRQLRRLLKIRRIGHCGTLDPLATGVLPIAVGEGTRLVEFVMEGVKVYRAELELGTTTDTQDCEGAVVATAPLDGIDEAAIRSAIASFLGEIEQIPPMYSALKRDGVPLYRLARQGVEVERAPRRVTIYRLDRIEVDLPRVTFEVTCSKGTYIRTLVHDLGQRLGCGAHLTALRRLRSGPFVEDDAVAIDNLTPESCAERLRPPIAAMSGYPAVDLTTEEAGRRLRNGIPPTLAEVAAPEGLADGRIVLIRYDGAVLAIARFEPERLVEARGDFVILRGFPANL